MLLNQCFQSNVEENHWLQSIQQVLFSSGLGNIWSNPPEAGQFHKVLKPVLTTRLFKNGKALFSLPVAFSTRRELSVAFQLSEYINAIRNPDIRLMYTRLRTDLNALPTCRASKKQSQMCPMCNKKWSRIAFCFALSVLLNRKKQVLWLY